MTTNNNPDDSKTSSGTRDTNHSFAIDLKTGLTVGDFKLIKCVGVGGMGEVWLAEQPAMGRNVALKILSPSLTGNKNFVSRFLLEVKTSAKLNHPNIVTAFHAGIDKGLYYLAISYVDGMELRDYLESNGEIPENESLIICEKIADALKYAWNKFKIIHRDIKPSNIMIEKDINEPHLMDMGISKSVHESNELTLTGTIIGTPYYMSPEQARTDDSIDCRSDIYSLGATLYHILTGEVPYEANSPLGILSKLISDPVPDPRRKNSEITEATFLLLKKMMAKAPSERQQTWEEVIDDINRILKGDKANSASPGASAVKTAPSRRDDSEAKTDSVLKNSKAAATAKRGSGAEMSEDLICLYCGSNNKPNARFCMGCGKNISKKCPECTEDIPVNIKFCSKCGTDLERMSILEDILKNLRLRKKEDDWSAVVETDVDLKDLTKLSGKRSGKLVSEIREIQNEALEFLLAEKAYENTNDLVSKLMNESEPLEAYGALRKFLAEHPKSEYVPEIKFRLKKLKKTSYNGPVTGDSWILPELEISLKPISPGKFTMGSYPGNFIGIGKEEGRQKNEGPLHEVVISKPFWMASCVTTIRQYLMFYDLAGTKRETLWPSKRCSPSKAGKDESISNGCWGSPENPMIDVNHINANEFCRWLNISEIERNRLPDGYVYRLPTEAEWEYCCRAGTTTRFSFGDDERLLDEFAWHSHNSNARSNTVGSKAPNPWELFDMHGNVWEWCADKYANYTSDSVADPYNGGSGRDFVRRGGSWINGAKHCRSAYRNYWDERCEFDYLGFRIVLAPKTTFIS